jgi:uncharacterized protein (DUF58 family)
VAEQGTQSRRLLDAEFLRKLERLALVSKRVRAGQSKGERKSTRKGSSVEFADYRDYVQGDDLRHVDWNIVGRLDALYLKLFQEQEDITLHVLIDASASMGFGTPSKLDFACKTAAALGYVALAKYDRLSIEAFCGDQTLRLPACRGKASASRMLGFLESIGAEGVTRLDSSCRLYSQRHPRKGIAVLISDLLDPAGCEGIVKRLTTSGSDAYVIHVLSRDELEPPISGDLRLVDSETKAFAEISTSRALLKRYNENLRGFCDAAKRACTARRCAYISAVSDMDFEKLVLGLLRRGGLVK